MAGGPTVRVDGIKEVRGQLRDLKDKVGKDMLKDANKQLADKVVDLAMPRVPERSGALKATVRGLGSVSAATAKVGVASVPYAAAIHWGVGARAGKRGPHNIKARPFLHDAIGQIEPDAADEYARQLNDIIHRLKGL